MKKILFVINENLRKAGNQTLMMSIVRELSNTYSFDVLLFDSKNGYYDEEFLSYGGRIYHIPNYEGKNKLIKKIDFYLRWIWNGKRVRKILLNNYGVIHCTNNFESAYILKEAKKAGIPSRISMSVIITKEYNALRSFYNSICLKIINKYATVKLACSKEAGETTFKNGYQIISNSYKKEFDVPIKDVKFDNPVLIQIASYNSNKDQVFTIKVFNELLKFYPNAKLNFVGFENENGYQNRMLNLINELDIKDNVKMYESNANTIELLDNSTHLMLPSHLESFGIVLLEAQARGVKCIVSDTVVKDADVGGCSFLAYEIGEKEWAKFIAEDFRINRGKHQKYDTSKFSEENITKQYDLLYQGKEIDNKDY